MVKGLARSISRGKAQVPQMLTLRVRSKQFVVDGATGVGFGSFVAGGLPFGNILLLGAVAYLQFTGPGSAGLTDTWEGDFGVGSTPASDGTITGADVDIIPSTALAAATAEASPVTRGTGATQVIIDNTDGSAEVNVSLLVDDASISSDDLTFTANGEIYLAYMVLGDD